MVQNANALVETITEELSSKGMAPPLANTPSAVDANAVVDQRTGRAALVRWVALGAFGGLIWGAALRAWMAVLALQFGEQPHFTWSGAFAAILLPAALMGAVLGGAACMTKTSRRKRWRWAILSPLLLVLGPFLFTDDFIPTLVTTGMGSGAIFVALIGVLGGYAFSGFGARWMRWGLGLITVSLVVAAIVTGGGASPPAAIDAFSMLYFVLLLIVLIAGVSIPSHLGRDT